ncbi:MAG: hypothetical protein LBG15_06745 [Dysgonamonadaceae bacterium]|jgi:uncharacterized protein|nr:hypothetical protein [Dysgonamonadaceae bacterium]
MRWKIRSKVFDLIRKKVLNLNNENISSFVNAAKIAGYKYISCSGGLSVGKFYNCYASKFHYIEINYDGKIYKCTARGYTDDYVLGEILDDGSVKWDEKKISKLYDKPTFDNPNVFRLRLSSNLFGPLSSKNS